VLAYARQTKHEASVERLVKILDTSIGRWRAPCLPGLRTCLSEFAAGAFLNSEHHRVTVRR
jgi:hypothetical protein